MQWRGEGIGNGDWGFGTWDLVIGCWLLGPEGAQADEGASVIAGDVSQCIQQGFQVGVISQDGAVLYHQMLPTTRRYHDGLADTGDRASGIPDFQPHGFLPDVAVHLAHRPALEEECVGSAGEEGFPRCAIGGRLDVHRGDDSGFFPLFVPSLLVSGMYPFTALQGSCMLRGMRIRKARLDDSAELARLHRGTIRHINKHDYSEQEIAVWSKRTNARRFRTSHDLTIRYVAEEDGKIVGFSDINKADPSEFWGLYVHKDHIGHGIGSRLMQKMEEVARKMGAKKFTLESTKTAQSFYEKQGFRMVQKGVHSIGDQTLDIMVMEKEL
jgi:putative acetyltransferase